MWRSFENGDAVQQPWRVLRQELSAAALVPTGPMHPWLGHPMNSYLKVETLSPSAVEELMVRLATHAETRSVSAQGPLAVRLMRPLRLEGALPVRLEGALPDGDPGLERGCARLALIRPQNSARSPEEWVPGRPGPRRHSGGRRSSRPAARSRHATADHPRHGHARRPLAARGRSRREDPRPTAHQWDPRRLHPAAHLRHLRPSPIMCRPLWDW